MKHIYGEIINFATKAQSSLDLNEAQNNHIAEIKIANRKMVEVIRDVRELSRNISLYLNSDNEYISKEYNKLRKKVAKVLRVIHRFRTEDDKEKYHRTLLKLSKEAKESFKIGNLEFDKLIRKDLITVDMASSYVMIVIM